MDGEWLLSEDGNKILAEGTVGTGSNGKDGADGRDGMDGKDGADGKDGKDGTDGKDGITPQFKIENGDWYISLDNGHTWEYLGRATGADGKDGANGKDGIDGSNGKDGADGQNGDSMFRSVDTSNPDYVIFILNDGTQLTIPRRFTSDSSSFAINFDQEEFTVQPGSTYTINYTITGGDANTQINVYEKNGLKAEIIKKSDTEGSIEISTPSTMTPKSIHELIVLVNDGGSKTLMKTLIFSKGMGHFTNHLKVVNSDDYTAEVILNTNLLSYSIEIPEEAKSWLSIKPTTRAQVREDKIEFILNRNNGGSRNAIVQIKDENNLIIDKISIVQLGNTTKVMTVAVAGQAGRAITSEDRENIEYLIVSGTLDKSDFTSFKGIKNLKWIDLSGVTDKELPSRAMEEFNIETVILPSQLIEIPNYCFYNCKSLTSIDFPNSVTIIGQYGFYNCTSLSGTLRLPSSLTEIGAYAFQNCSSLSGDLIIPDNVIDINQRAFVDCLGFNGNLVIGKNVQRIASSAFTKNGGQKLNFSKIYCKANTPPHFSSVNGSNYFGDQNYAGFPLYLGVPKGCSQLYRNVRECNFFSIIEEVDFEKLGY